MLTRLQGTSRALRTGDRQTSILSSVSSQLLQSCSHTQKYGHEQKQCYTGMTSLLGKHDFL